MPMRGRWFRCQALRGLASLALLGAFLALTIVAYGVFLASGGRMMLSPVPQFSDFYETGKNPWAGPTWHRRKQAARTWPPTVLPRPPQPGIHLPNDLNYPRMAGDEGPR
jgi:hypothetical protein